MTFQADQVVNAMSLSSDDDKFSHCFASMLNKKTLETKTNLFVQNDPTNLAGLYQGVLDERLKNFLLMEKIKVEFRGLPQGSTDVKEQQFHAVTEVTVYGRYSFHHNALILSK